MDLRDRFLSSVREADPLAKAREVVSKIPDIVTNCPDNLYDFVEKLRLNGLMVDNYPFRWEGFEYLVEPYKSFKIYGGEDPERMIQTWMCGAQVSKTVTEFLLLVWLAIRFWGRYLGYFLPDKTMADNYSADRFKPMVRGISEIKPYWGKDPSSDDIEGMTDKKGIRSIGPSKILFSYMGGVTSTEGWPLLGIIFDEVRRMMDGDIERALFRISFSPYPINIQMSTAGYPDVNIDKAFKKTKQSHFHSKCRCPDGVVLSTVFPDCVGHKLPGMTAAFRDLPNYFWICPTCKEPILNPRVGRWIAHNPMSLYNGYHIPRILSSSIQASPEQIIEAYNDCKDIQEFFNSQLGIAYISKENMLITEEILRATVNPDLRWLTSGQNFAMGIDQMGGFNVIVVRYRGPKTDSGIGKSRLAHIEIVWADDPWERCDELMTQFDISICVADAVPNFNEARRFAKRHPGRVFLSEYNYTPEKGDADICEWGDRPKKTPGQKKASAEILNKWRVRINRYLAIEWNLMKYVNRMKEQARPEYPLVDIQDNVGRKKSVFLCKEVFWVHLQKIVKKKNVNEDTGEIRMDFENLGLDPHFVHADLYAEIALSRIGETGTGAFSEFHKAAEELKAVKPTDHNFEPTANPQHFRCSGCKLMVSQVTGMTLQQVADKVGMGECVKKA
jgi:hypothetical protein